jgi:hypothetical protein
MQSKAKLSRWNSDGVEMELVSCAVKGQKRPMELISYAIKGTTKPVFFFLLLRACVQ